MNPSDPLDLSGYAPDVQRWLARVKPERLLPDRPPSCALCRDTHVVPEVGADGQTRYRSCRCVRAQDDRTHWARLAALPDIQGLEDVRLEKLVPNLAQYAAYRAVNGLFGSPPAQGLVVLFGHAGMGKTQFAAAAAWGLVAHMEVAYYEAPRLVRLLRTGGRYDDGALEERLAQLGEVGALIIDGLGTEPSTEWANSALQELINARYRRRLPLLITTSVPLAHMSEMLAARFLDMSRSRLAVISGTLLDQGSPEKAPLHVWMPGAMSKQSNVYTATQDAGSLICPRCQSRPCLNVCPDPLFRAPETPA